MKTTKSFFLLSLLAFVFLITSTCKESNWIIVDCSDCYIEKPLDYAIELKITLNDENPKVPLTFIRGSYEEGVIEFRDTVYLPRRKFYLETDTHYTIVAKYMRNAREYNVITGARLETHFDTSSCDEECYYVTGTSADLRMKF